MNKNQNKEHKDTTTSLHPLSFDEAIRELAKPIKPKDSKTEASDNTKEASPEPETSN